MWMKYTIHDCAIDVTELSFSLFLKVALDIRTRLRYLMGHENRVALSYTHIIRSNVNSRFFIEAKGIINVHSTWKI